MKTILQIRIDDNLKKQASAVYESLGMDLSTAVRIFLMKSVSQNGLPFDLRNEKKEKEVLAAVKEMHQISKQNDNSEMTLDEINREINKSRKSKN